VTRQCNTRKKGIDHAFNCETLFSLNWHRFRELKTLENSDKAEKTAIISKFQNIRKLLEEEKIPTISELCQIYFNANLDYIHFCENTNSVHYHPSGRYDKRLEKLVEMGKAEKVRPLVISRIDELILCLSS